MDLLDCIKEYIPDDIEKQTKELYDEAYKSRSFKVTKSEALPELIIDGFDTEQIWQQIELANNEMLGRFGLETITKALMITNLELPVKVVDKDTQQSSEGSESEEEEEEEEMEEEMEEEEEEEKEEASGECEESDDDDDDDFVNKNTKRKSKQQTSSNSNKKRKSEVEDQFFNLKEMDEYLLREEKKEMAEGNSSDEDDIPVNLFIDPDENEASDGIKEGRAVKYSDFFDSPENENEGDGGFDDNNGEEGDDDHDEDDDDDDNYDDDEHEFNDEDNGDNIDDEKPLKENQKKVKFNLLADSDNSDSEEMDKNKNEEGTNENKSSLEAREERLKKKIAQLEKEAVSEKPWQLKGEATARSRPKDSLLEEYVEFDTGLKPAPVMTEQTTMKLEDIIRSRIKDKAWDDVEKKIKPVETPLEYKKKLVMNQEKSKESLAEIYANEYVRQRETLTAGDKEEEEKEEPPEHIEIRERLHSLFRKLDALSNFHYTPKLAKPEIKIVSNIPAVNMEEVAPVATSDATLLAPEEVKGKPKGDLLGKSERTKTDKKRERRKKKIKQHNRAIYNSKKEAEDELKQEKNKNKKKPKVDAPKIKGRNIINAPDSTNKQIKSSTAFFTQLQNEVTTGIQEKLGVIKAKKKKDTLSAAKLKL